MKGIQDVQRPADPVHGPDLSAELNEKGYFLVPGFLTPEQCDQIRSDYDHPAYYRKTIVMERYRFGLGEYKYFRYPLPGLIQSIRESIYPVLAPIANNWMHILKIDTQFPTAFEALQEKCRANKQMQPTPLILKYGKGGHNTLHQDLYGEVYFPLQAVVLLSEPGEDFEGGEFVLTQQVPRAQSKVIVLKPEKGTMLIFTSNFRPIKGAKGYYRAQMKHGVSELHSGQRHSLGIIFHDALS